MFKFTCSDREQKIAKILDAYYGKIGRTLKNSRTFFGCSSRGTNRDASIQRFGFTLEAVWKLTQLFLREREGFEIGSPKGVMKHCLQVGLLTAEQTSMAIAMVDARNLTVHTYNEALAIEIYNDLPGYFELLGRFNSEVHHPRTE